MRIRTVKPEFWHSEKIAGTSYQARLLALALLNHADDEGFFRANYLLIKNTLFPYDIKFDIEKHIKELIEIGYIKLFKSTDDCQYGQVVSFEDHQVINRPKASKIKEKTIGVISHGSISDQSRIDHTGKEWKGKEWKGKEWKGMEGNGSTLSSSNSTLSKDLFDYYKSYHKHARPGDKERKLVNARIKEGYTLDDLKKAIDGCHKSPHHCGENERRRKYQTLDLILRDSGKVAMFIELDDKPQEDRKFSGYTPATKGKDYSGGFLE